jgi:pilus assembly protein Flp/PilA
MRNLIKRLLSEERGATAIEYGLIAGLIAVVIIGALTVTGTSLKSVFESVSGELETVAGTGGSGGSGGSGGGGGTP